MRVPYLTDEQGNCSAVTVFC